MDLEKFVTKTIDLLEKERQAEIDETRFLTQKVPAKELQRKGVCLLKLRLNERRSGLYGRTVVTFEPFWSGNDLPSHNLTPGDIVGLNLSQSEGHADNLASGIVSKVNQSKISIAFDEATDVFSLDDDVQYKLTKLANDVTYKRLKGALKNLNRYTSGRSGNLINVLFHVSELSPPSQSFEIEFYNDKLDDSQKEAVKFSLLQKELAVIHGPPGTGKTTTVVEVILQAVKQGLKVLACAPSNIAVDNLVERISRYKQKIVRIGHPARLLPTIQKFALDSIVANSEETRLVEDVRKDLDNVLAKMKTSKNKGAKHGLYAEIKVLRKELRERAAEATRQILTKAEVVLVTLTSATDDGPLKFLEKDHFDLVVIDENSQALEAACWISLLRAPRCILAGDHCQLPPTILSKQAAKEGLGETLMERIINHYGNEVVRMLTTQYRMNEAIMQWSSDQLYGGKLTAHSSVQSHLLKDLPNVSDCEETEIPLLMIDTAGCDLFELDLLEEISKGNEGEANIVVSHVEKLISCGLSAEDIAVIAPYNMQVDILRGKLSKDHPKLEIKSVDGFQGREKEAVILTFVRSNAKGEVGFLAENRRINVAITRARRHVAVICDSDTVSNDKFLKSLVDYFNENGEVWSAHEYLEGEVQHVSIKHESKYSENLKQQNKPTSDKLEKKNTEEADKKKEEEFTRRLEKFKTGKKESMIFSSKLNSHDRLLVHQISDKLSLLHVSKGEGKDRCIEVRKPGSSDQSDPSIEQSNSQSSSTIQTSNYQLTNQLVQETETTQSESLSQKDIAVNISGSNEKEENESKQKLTTSEDQNNDSSAENVGASALSEGAKPKSKMAIVHVTSVDYKPDTEFDHVIKRKPSDKVTCLRCKKDVIRSNIELHELHCYRDAKQQEVQKSADVKKKEKGQTQKSISKKENANHNRTCKALQKVDGDDFDKMLETVTKLDKFCAFQKCKVMTLTLGQTCNFCSQRFCFTHFTPEVHGCGAQAKCSARQTIVREGVIYQGSGVPDKKPNPDRKSQLKKKMDKKLDDLSTRRLPKKPK